MVNVILLRKVVFDIINPVVRLMHIKFSLKLIPYQITRSKFWKSHSIRKIQGKLWENFKRCLNADQAALLGSLPGKGLCQTITKIHKTIYIGSCCLVRGNWLSNFYFKNLFFRVSRLSWAVDCPGSEYSAGPAGVDYSIILKSSNSIKTYLL